MTTSATKHSAEIHAWLPKYIELEGLFDSPSNRVVTAMSYSTNGPGTGCVYEREGYTYVGTAAITLQVGGRDQMVGQRVAALRAEKQSVLADAQSKAVAIDRKIQTLLAITHEPTGGVA